MDSIQQTKVIIQQIKSPAEFYIQFSNHTEKCANQNMADDCADRSVWKCHLAFLAPIDNISWTLTAIDKFKQYTEQFIGFAISQPRSLTSVTTSTTSTGVILWGLVQQNDVDDENDNTLDAQNVDSWRNINLQMIFQGMSQPTAHIEQFYLELLIPSDVHSEMNKQKTDDGCRANKIFGMSGKQAKQAKRTIHRNWPSPQKNRSKEFTGTPVYIDDEFTIYVQEWDHQKCVEHMSNKLTKLHKNRKKYPHKFWREGDICSVKCRDGMFHRGKIKQICKDVCLVNLVDFGCNELVKFVNLSTRNVFHGVPIQVRKCRLFNIAINSEEQITEAVKFGNESILGEICSFYIHDHLDPLHLDAIICNLRSSNAELDLATLLISNELAQYGNLLNKPIKFEQCNEEKRRRKQLDEPIFKPSSELHSYEDFQQFYENNKVTVPVLCAQDELDEQMDRTFEIFERPSKRSPLDELTSISDDLVVCNRPHPLIDRITQHFNLLQLDEPTFYCRVLNIIDPITIAIAPNDTNPPPQIDVFDSQYKYFPMEEYMPCIAFLDNKWRRGIVWEKISTNKHLILFVDTLQIVEIQRSLIRICPPEFLGSTLPFAKVHLSKITPNKRLRAQDVCDALSNVILNENLFTKFVGVRNDGIPEIKLYISCDSKYTIYEKLTRNKFYKKFK